MATLQLRRERRPDSLAAAVIELLDDYQCPISTQAVRVILTARGRPVPAERLSRLAAYQREDFERTKMPPELCWTLTPDAVAVTPRWWARGQWRLMRRIQTNDVMPIWYVMLATPAPAAILPTNAAYPTLTSQALLSRPPTQPFGAVGHSSFPPPKRIGCAYVRRSTPLTTARSTTVQVEHPNRSKREKALGAARIQPAVRPKLTRTAPSTP